MISSYEYQGLVKSTHPDMEAWLTEPAQSGCQTSMLLPAALGKLRPGEAGLDCHRAAASGGPNVTLSEEEVQSVVRLVEDPDKVPFVGILEFWDASIALFHATFEDGVPVQPEELENIHPTNKSSGSYTYCAAMLEQPIYCLRRARRTAARLRAFQCRPQGL